MPPESKSAAVENMLAGRPLAIIVGDGLAIPLMIGQSIVVLDETVDMVKLVENLIYFYHHESCGQCTPCREGLGWMLKIVKKLLAGEGSIDDIDLLVELCDNIEMKTVCVLSAACTMPVRSYLNKFRHEFEAYVSDAAS